MGEGLEGFSEWRRQGGVPGRGISLCKVKGYECMQEGPQEMESEGGGNQEMRLGRWAGARLWGALNARQGVGAVGGDDQQIARSILSVSEKSQCHGSDRSRGGRG